MDGQAAAVEPVPSEDAHKADVQEPAAAPGSADTAIGSASTSADVPIASEADLMAFTRLPLEQRQLTDPLRGVLAESALTGRIRYKWPLLRPLVDFVLEQVLTAYDAETQVEVGPSGPDPISQTIERFKTLLSAFSDAPWTFQRLCEILLEPKRQYSRLPKLVLAIEKCLMVTGEQAPTDQAQLPPPPMCSSLGPVNVNPSPVYTGGHHGSQGAGHGGAGPSGSGSDDSGSAFTHSLLDVPSRHHATTRDPHHGNHTGTPEHIEEDHWPEGLPDSGKGAFKVGVGVGLHVGHLPHTHGHVPLRPGGGSPGGSPHLGSPLGLLAGLGGGSGSGSPGGSPTGAAATAGHGAGAGHGASGSPTVAMEGAGPHVQHTNHVHQPPQQPSAQQHAHAGAQDALLAPRDLAKEAFGAAAGPAGNNGPAAGVAGEHGQEQPAAGAAADSGAGAEAMDLDKAGDAAGGSGHASLAPSAGQNPAQKRPREDDGAAVPESSGGAGGGAGAGGGSDGSSAMLLPAGTLGDAAACAASADGPSSGDGRTCREGAVAAYGSGNGGAGAAATCATRQVECVGNDVVGPQGRGSTVCGEMPSSTGQVGQEEGEGLGQGADAMDWAPELPGGRAWSGAGPGAGGQEEEAGGPAAERQGHGSSAADGAEGGAEPGAGLR